MSLEKPEYEVIRKDGDIEIRNYKGYIAAQVDIRSDYNTALTKGFRILADYIFGNNIKRSKISMTAPVTQEIIEESEKIPMTAPVTQEIMEKDVYKVSFMMPSKYTLETLPEPANKQIKINKVDGFKAAVIRCSGYLNRDLAGKKINELNGWLHKNNLEPHSNFIAARYDPPWIPGFLRRNEVMVKI